MSEQQVPLHRDPLRDGRRATKLPEIAVRFACIIDISYLATKLLQHPAHQEVDGAFTRGHRKQRVKNRQRLLQLRGELVQVILGNSTLIKCVQRVPHPSPWRKVEWPS